MSDLNDKQAGLTVKLAGGDPTTGVEDYFAEVDANGRLQTLAFQGTSPWVISGTVIANEDKNYGTVGATTLRTAAQLGNATGAANFNFGTVGAQTLRTAAQIGNATGAADFGAGVTGAQTLRTESNQGAPNTVANGWPTKITDGTNTAKVTATSDLRVSDVLDNGGVDGYVALNIFPVEVKVGASIKTDRKFVILQGKSNYIVWGFSNTTQSFSIAYNQFVMVPLAPGTTIWAKVTAGGSGFIAVGEVS